MVGCCWALYVVVRGLEVVLSSRGVVWVGGVRLSVRWLCLGFLLLVMGVFTWCDGVVF